MSTFSTIAHSLRQNLHAAGYPVSLGHCQQVVSTLLGYNTLAAFQTSDLCLTNLSRVRHVVIDGARIIDRTEALGSFPSGEILLPAIAVATDASWLRATTHSSVMHFEDYLRKNLEQFVEEDGDVISEMTNANHDGVDEVYLPFEIEVELAEPDQFLSIGIEGHVGLREDNERPFSGNKINVVANISMERLSMSTFTDLEYLVVSASLDYE